MLLLARDEDDPPEVLAWLWTGADYVAVTTTYLALLLSVQYQT